MLTDRPRKVCQILRTAPKKPLDSNPSYLERINRAIDFIIHAIARGEKPIRLTDIASAAEISPYHFHRVFQSIVGETPADFVKRRRLDKALGLMVHARKPIFSAIATDCGFSSISDFSRAFKHQFGVSPSRFDFAAWRAAHRNELEALVYNSPERFHVHRLPSRENPDGFRVHIRDIPARTVAYIRVHDPYAGDGAYEAVRRLVAWADREKRVPPGGGQWLGYQWENPEITPLKDCCYHAAVVVEPFKPRGEVGMYRFPPMVVAQVEIRGGIDLELRALQWLKGSWLPRSGYVPDDFPLFESWIGRPFAHGTEHFTLHALMPIRRDYPRPKRS